MVEEYEKLSHEDISNLINNHDPESKIKVIEKLSHQYDHSNFSDSQIELAEQIFRLLLRQTELEVRKALSDNLMYSKSIPHDVVFALARDVEEVSLPMLEFSEVLNDDDLMEIINTTQTTSSQVAIANRVHVSESVSKALVDTHNTQVVGTLLRNDNASIADESYDVVLNDFSDNEVIVDSMITRGSLSQDIIAQMTEKVSASIQQKIEKKYEHSFKDISKFFKESSEVAAFKFLSQQEIDRDLIELVDNLEKKGKLIESLDPTYGTLSQLLDGIEQVGQLTPLSALAVGHQVLFEIAISRITGVPLENAEKLIRDREGGLSALYKRAQLPPKLYEAVYFVTGIIQDMDQRAEDEGTTRAKDDLHSFVKNIMQESKGKNIPNLAHFISVIRHHVEEDPEHWA